VADGASIAARARTRVGRLDRGRGPASQAVRRHWLLARDLREARIVGRFLRSGYAASPAVDERATLEGALALGADVEL
jgi:hypothetical protein